jgi:hypothetical protein
LNSRGVATYTTSTLTGCGASACHLISAVYAGNYAGSRSNAIYQMVNRLPVAMTLNASLNPSTYGQSVTYSGTISVPGAVVNFEAGSVTSEGAVTAGAAGDFSTSFVPPFGGEYGIYATYAGSSTYAPAEASLTQVVDLLATTTVLASSANPAPPGTAVTFSATVTASYGSLTGKVTFYDGTTVLGTVPLSANTAAYTSSTLTAGSHNIQASYSGSIDYVTSSATLVQVIQ